MLTKLFWIALTIFFTLAWLVLFDHGTTDYVKNFKQEVQDAREFFFSGPIQKDKKDHNGVL